MSGKLVVLVDYLKQWNTDGSKVLIFSQTKKILNLIELILKDNLKMSYSRMDGDVSLKSRMDLIHGFNEKDVQVFLLTTRVGGLGINLTAANKVVVFDPDWNPMVDM